MKRSCAEKVACPPHIQMLQFFCIKLYDNNNACISTACVCADHLFALIPCYTVEFQMLANCCLIVDSSFHDVCFDRICRKVIFAAIERGLGSYISIDRKHGESDCK